MPSDPPDSVRDLVRAFAARRLAGNLEEWDRPGALPVRELVPELGELGLLGLGVPAADGGSGGSRLDLCVAVEEIYRHSPALAASAYIGVLAASDLLASGDDAHRDLAASILAGETVAALAITEENAGSDVSAIETQAVRNGGRWRLDGAKRWVLNAPLADVIFVLTRTGESGGAGAGAGGRGRFGLFAVAGNARGMHVVPGPEAVSWRGASVADLRLEGCELDGSAVVGDPTGGLPLILAGFDLERVTLAAGAVGLALAAVETMRDRAASRSQFGQPIGAHQSVRFAIARAASEVEAARRLTYAAATEIDAGRRATGISSMAKLVATETAGRVTRQAVHLHGAEGLDADSAVARHHRDALIMTVGGGTSEMQLELVARDLGLPDA